MAQEANNLLDKLNKAPKYFITGSIEEKQFNSDLRRFAKIVLLSKTKYEIIQSNTKVPDKYIEKQIELCLKQIESSGNGYFNVGLGRISERIQGSNAKMQQAIFPAALLAPEGIAAIIALGGLVANSCTKHYSKHKDNHYSVFKEKEHLHTKQEDLDKSFVPYKEMLFAKKKSEDPSAIRNLVENLSGSPMITPPEPDDEKIFDRMIRCQGYGKVSRIKGTNLWATIDKGVRRNNSHGGVYWKIYKEHGNKLIHQEETDKLFKIINKHKGETGEVIDVKKECRGIPGYKGF